MKVCKKCGKSYQDNILVCPDCNVKLEEQIQDIVEDKTTNTSNDISKATKEITDKKEAVSNQGITETTAEKVYTPKPKPTPKVSGKGIILDKFKRAINSAKNKYISLAKNKQRLIAIIAIMAVATAVIIPIAVASTKPKEHTVAFMAWEGELLEVQTVKHDKDAIAPTEPTKEGHTFRGWDKPFVKVKGDLTVAALWDVNQYTVTFDIGDNTANDSISGDYGSVLTAPPTPTREGFAFVGWFYLDEQGKEQVFDFDDNTTIPAANIELFIKWEEIKYTYTFYDEDGTTVLGSDTIDYGSEIVSPDNPIKQATAQYTYTFDGWDKEVPDTITVDITFTATYASTVNQYTYTFYDENGTAVLKTATIDYGSEIVAPDNPTKLSTAQYTYTFASWGKEVPDTITANITFTATYTSTVNQYTYTFYNEDATTALKTATVDYGSEIVAPDNPTKQATAQYTYTFAGWDKEVPDTITENITFVATYTSTVNQYTYTFFDEDGTTVLKTDKVDYGSEIVAPDNPTKQTTAQYTYTFASWGKEVPDTITANITFTATYTSTVNQYTYIFYDEDGTTVLKTATIDYGSEIVAPPNPTKQTTAQYTYTFASWDKEVPDTITADITFTATYTSTDNQYTYTFYDEDGTTVLKTATVDYGSEIVAPPNPTKQATAQYTYAFDDWDKEVPDTITVDITFTATYTSTVNQYTYTFYDEDGTTVLKTYTVDYGSEIISPENAPIKADSEGYSYIFADWDKTVPTTITADIWFKATYTAQAIQYSIDYNLDSGINDDANPDIYTVTSATIILNNPTKEGYNFVGWCTALSGGEKIESIVTGSYGNISIYAIWQVGEYTLSFNTSGGDSLESLVISYGTEINYPTPHRNSYSFDGWFVDISINQPCEYITMPAKDFTIYAKWITYTVAISYNQEKTCIRESDDLTAELFEAEARDTDGNSIENITIALNSGTKEAGSTISVRLQAVGLYGKGAQLTIENIKVYGNPSLEYNTSKDFFSLSDTFDASLWEASGIDTHGVATTIVLRVLEEDYAGGDFVTVFIQSIDIVGNKTSATIENIKVYDKPIISYDEDRLAIKESDEISNVLWNVSAVDSFDEVLATTTSIISGTKVAGNTITVRIASTDSKGNTNNIDLLVKVYGTPTINSASKIDFKVTDIISVATVGITATDSHYDTVDDITISLKDGTQTAGSYMVYTIMATDIVGNIATKYIALKVYNTPYISTTRQAIKVVDDTSNISTFGVTAKDSFGTNLAVEHILKSGSQTGGTSIVYTFTATDNAGNIVIADYLYRVYDANDIDISFISGASDTIKLASMGEEFSATATDSFGECCTISILKADGTPLVAGATTNIILRATDVLGNYKDSTIINNIKVYDIPVVQYAYSEYYLKHGDNVEFMFTVWDSFGVELYAQVIETAYKDNVRHVTVVATDDAGNCFEQAYQLYQLGQNQSYLALYYQDMFIDYYIATSGENFALPDSVVGYHSFICWKLNGVAITDNAGNSLAPWDNPSGLYILQADMMLITYTVSYNLNGGQNSTNNPTSFSVLDLGGVDGAIILAYPNKIADIVIVKSEYIGGGQYLTIAETTEYTFLGWYMESSFINRVYALSLSLGSITLFASWSSETTTTTIIITAYTTYQRISSSGEPTTNGEYIFFGEYPQTIKASNVTIGTTQDSRGYYLGSDGYYYAKVTATPYQSGYKFSTGTTVTSGTVYYFKVEPIKWRILEESNGNALILCESILANKRYHASSNNYMNSEIRSWLNNEFYNTAFSELQQQLIQVTNVDNSVYSTGYDPNQCACANTNDKIFLPSYREMVNASYGFNSDYSAYDTARRRLTSDYSRATGAYMLTNSTYYGNGWWWLRSPSSSYSSNSARSINNDGYVHLNYYVHNTEGGVVPALTIKLS